MVENLVDDYRRVLDGSDPISTTRDRIVSNLLAALESETADIHMWFQLGGPARTPGYPAQQVVNRLAACGVVEPAQAEDLLPERNAALLLRQQVPNMVFACKRRILGHAESVAHLAASHDGRKVVSISTDGTVYLWDARTWRRLDDITQHEVKPFCAVFSRDDGSLILRSDDGLWTIPSDSRNSKPTRYLADLPRLDRVAFSSTGDLLAYTEGAADLAMSESANRIAVEGCPRPTITVLHVADGRRQRLDGHTSRVLDIEFSTQEDYLASSSCDGTVRLWDLQSATDRVLLRGTPFASDQVVRSVRFSRTNEHLACLKQDSLTVMQFQNGSQPREIAEGRSGYEGLAVSGDGSVVAVSNGFGPLQVWRVSDGALMAEYVEMLAECAKVWLLPDGKTVATAGSEGEILIYELPSAAAHPIELGEQAEICALAISPDGCTTLVGKAERKAGEGLVLLWDNRQHFYRRVLAHTEKESRGHIRDVKFSPSGRLAACSSEHGYFYLWNLGSETPVRMATGYLNTVRTSRISPDERWLSCGPDHEMFWALTGTGRPLPKRLFDIEGAMVVGNTQAVGFMPDGRMVCLTDENVLELRCSGSNTSERLFELPEKGVAFGDVAPNGDLIALSVEDEIWFIDVLDRRLKSRGQPFGGIIRFSPDGRSYATGGQRSPIRLVDLASGAALAEAQTSGPICDLRFSPAGHCLWAVVRDSTQYPGFYPFGICNLAREPPIVTAWKSGRLYASCPFCVGGQDDPPSSQWDGAGWPFVVRAFPPEALGRTVVCASCRNKLRLADLPMHQPPLWWKR